MPNWPVFTRCPGFLSFPLICCFRSDVFSDFPGACTFYTFNLSFVWTPYVLFFFAFQFHGSHIHIIIITSGYVYACVLPTFAGHFFLPNFIFSAMTFFFFLSFSRAISIVTWHPHWHFHRLEISLIVDVNSLASRVDFTYYFLSSACIAHTSMGDNTESYNS